MPSGREEARFQIWTFTESQKAPPLTTTIYLTVPVYVFSCNSRLLNPQEEEKGLIRNIL